MARDSTPPSTPFLPSIPDHTLLRVIGAGSYGQVWLARSATGAFRAVKIVRYEAANEGRDFARAFKGLQHYEPISREDKSLMDVLHVGIVEAEAYFYCVMELADPAPGDGISSILEASAPSLRSPTNADLPWDPLAPVIIDPARYEPLTLRLLQCRHPRLPVAECVEIGIALCRALGALHGHGLVHRDVKPSNIIFARGQPKLADIDLVTPAEGSMRRRVTEGYTAPEGAGSMAADIYSLGKVLYEISTGRDRTEFPAPGEDLAPGECSMWANLNEVLLRACEEDPKRRQRSAREMHDELRLVQAERPVRRLRALEHRQRLLMRIGVISLLVGLVTLGALLRERYLGRQLREAESRAVQSLVQLHVANGRRALDEDFLHQATLWFGRALELARDSDTIRELHHRIDFLLGSSPRLVGMGAHSNSITEVMFHPDGEEFVTASDDGTARFWNTQTGEPVGAPLLHPAAINDVRYSPDGKRVATASVDGTVHIWQVPAAAAAPRVLHHGREVFVVSFSPDGRLLLSGGQEGRVRVWGTDSGDEVIAPIQHESDIHWATFSPDSRTFVTASKDGKVGVWNVDTGAPLFPHLRHSQSVDFAAFSPDGKRLLTACRDGIARFWNATTGAPEPLEIRHERLNYAGFSHDGKRVVTATGGSSEPSEVRIWNAVTGQAQGPPLRHDNRIRYAVFSPDDRWLATASHDGIVQVLRVGENGPTARLTLGDRTWALAFDAKSSRLLTAGRERIWRLWDLSSQAQRKIQTRYPSPETYAHTSASAQWISAITELGGTLFQVESTRLAPAAESHWNPLEAIEIASAFDLREKHILLQRSTGKLALLSLPHLADTNLRIAADSDITSASLSGDGRMVLVGTKKGSIHIWRLHANRWSEEVLQTPFSSVTRIASSPSDPFAVLCGTQETEQDAGFAMVRLGPQISRIGTVRWQTKAKCQPPAFSPDGRYFAIGFSWPRNHPTTVPVIDTNTDTEVFEPLPHPDGVGRLAFSPDGSILYTGATDGFLRTWSISTGRQSLPPLRHGSAVSSVAVSADGQLLATGSSDGTARVWNSRSGDALSPRLRHAANVHTVAFSTDARRLVTMTVDGELRLYALKQSPDDTKVLQDRLEVEAGSTITRDGRSQLLQPDALLERWQRVTTANHGASGPNSARQPIQSVDVP